MRFTLDIRPAARSCIDGAPLTREGRIRLYVGLNDLAEISDAVRQDPANRQGRHFLFEHLFRDAGRIRAFRVRVDDSSASYGILRLVYADLI